MGSTSPLIFHIQRFSVNDGPGIRTTVFLKGCMLRCLWCHNPESKSPNRQLMFHQEKCIGCGVCASVCPNHVHQSGENGEHRLDRTLCKICGQCADNCIGALELIGKEMTVEEILEEVQKDRAFFQNSGGGMTLSGGEPLLYPQFTRNLLQAAKAEGLHTCLETCGYAEWETIEPLLPYTDLFLWDVKETDAERHRAYTGVSAGANIILRCPIIPGYNDRETHFKAIAALAEALSGVIRVDIEPYHPLGNSKNESLDLPNPMPKLSFPTDEAVSSWISAVAQHTSKPVQKA